MMITDFYVDTDNTDGNEEVTLVLLVEVMLLIKVVLLLSMVMVLVIVVVVAVARVTVAVIVTSTTSVSFACSWHLCTWGLIVSFFPPTHEAIVRSRHSFCLC